MSSNTKNFQILIYCLAFSSGFCIMGIELLGGRILAPFFGSSVHIWGSIITVFMLSLSIGYLLGGKLSTQQPNLKLYGSLFLTSGLLILPIVYWSPSLMEFIFIRVEDTRYGSLLAASALFFFPTIVLGMISPYSVRLLVKDQNTSGQVAGTLYFVSTLGSALGTIVTSFYLVLYFNVDQIIFTLSMTLIGLGFLALSIYFTQQKKPSHYDEA